LIFCSFHNESFQILQLNRKKSIINVEELENVDLLDIRKMGVFELGMKNNEEVKERT
jgi:hypothetical protein